MNRKYDFFDFSQTIQNWTWQELAFGLEEKIISRKDVVDYAIYILEEGIIGFDLVLKISIADEYEDISIYMSRLSVLENQEQNSSIEDKWRYVILQELYNKQTNYDDVYEKVEEVYADFDYPEDMVGFIRYMPSIDGKDMEESWQEYLANAKEKYL